MRQSRLPAATRVGRRLNTMLRLTPAGRAAFQNYRREMKPVLDDLPE